MGRTPPILPVLAGVWLFRGGQAGVDLLLGLAARGAVTGLAGLAWPELDGEQGNQLGPPGLYGRLEQEFETVLFEFRCWSHPGGKSIGAQWVLEELVLSRRA